MVVVVVFVVAVGIVVVVVGKVVVVVEVEVMVIMVVGSVVIIVTFLNGNVLPSSVVIGDPELVAVVVEVVPEYVVVAVVLDVLNELVAGRVKIIATAIMEISRIIEIIKPIISFFLLSERIVQT